ncbi:uncharacterized protein LOC127285988 [Leptopilina boulardi]|uniref:uncharacterized protein LOC127285988 n=1 Tax=Leptopilina boulardi TaxID=63433 RepID=UPI0021F518E3|nr:uncharacterized protein LOC127285988 [Leptopilina boulardi]XP_051168197.1 uncharacterized protein LOC127285988 [Leptopilina boulardi]
MASLVADYGSSSGSDNESDNVSENGDSISKEKEEDSDSDNDEGYNENKLQYEKLPLPTPDFNGTTTMKTSVFSNPFVEAEKAKSAILEKHVKMTPTMDDTKMINGRKICWNYRKGRCRFGHNCTFAHDSDLHRTASELEAMRAPQETIICQTSYNGQISMIDEDEIDQENKQTIKRKKRPGLSQTLVPGKKVLKMYKAQQAKVVGR